MLASLKGGFTQADLGGAAGVVTSKGAASLYAGIGMPLATAGIFGNRRGTGGGIAESTLGGALIGAGFAPRSCRKPR